MSSSLTWKRVLFWALIAGGALGLVALLVTGQWKTAKRLLLMLGIKGRAIEIQKLDAKREAAKTSMAADDSKLAALDAQYKALEKENAAAALQLEGKSHDEIAAVLRSRGF